MKIESVTAVHCIISKGPVWSVAEQALYFIDMLGKAVHRYDPQTKQTRSWSVGQVIGSMALRRAGGAIVSLRDGIYSLDFESGEVAALAKPGSMHPRVQMNDGKVDRRGRFFVGSYDPEGTEDEAHGALYRLDPDLSLSELEQEIGISNGASWSPDNKTFYFSDSRRHQIYAYDFDLETGSIANRRLFADTREMGGIPDGATVDGDGLLWVAICLGGKIAAFRPDGRIERIIEMPIERPASLTFGGARLDELYVATIDLRMDGREPDGGGDIFVISGLGARGIPEPMFAG